ncbi:MAG: hypothetical protein WCA37_03945 [Terracidiphilus sp.]
MSTVPVPPSPFPIAPDPDRARILARERQKSTMLRAWIASGLFFMALPGTLLGFSSLMSISTHHGLDALPAAWMQGHGHAQMFGWIGSFILGIGFYSQPLGKRSPVRLPLACFLLWTSGVLLRWLANVYLWHWRVLLPISATFELIAILLFLRAASRHKLAAPTGQATAHPKARPRMEEWMILVLLGTAGLAAAVVFNFVECILLARSATDPAFPHGLDQRYLVLLGWGFLAPVVWGFSTRWLPTFLNLPRPGARLLQTAMLLDIAGVLAGVSGWPRLATPLIAAAAAVIVAALHLTQKPLGPAKVLGIHPSFPIFIRAAYLWLNIAALLGILAAHADVHGGIWGASRHALTVGFAATMVFAIGPRILPHFTGIRELYSRQLMLLSLVLLQAGCTLRVSSEPLAYEGVTAFAWKTLPISGVLELSGVLIFGLNIALTMLQGKSAFIEVDTSHHDSIVIR